MNARGEDLLAGAACALLALLMLRRIFVGLRDGSMPLYRARLSRNDAGPAKFAALILFNVFLLLLMAVIAADLLLGLGLRGR